ncbi:MAG: PF20097 family protein [Blastocatellia bacterium]
MLHNILQLIKSNVACPQYETEFLEGTEVCPKCGYDFRLKECPYCKAELERGVIMGSGESASFLFPGAGHMSWFTGKANFETNWEQAAGGGERLSKQLKWAGTFVTGGRCTACRKIILSY